MDLDQSQERTTLILELFDRAADLSPSERAEYLSTACADDSTLRREVEDLLRMSERADEILLQYEKPLFAGTTKGLTGRLVSHYEVIGRLGGGGMGEVYKAHDTKLDRIVVLKFLPPHLNLDAESKRRFIVEAKAASSLDHPNICTIYEIDETEPVGFGAEPRLFIAMAFVDGGSLKELIDRGPLRLDDVLSLGSQIADGLSAAHAHGIVHRDVKSANIIIAKPAPGAPGSGVAKIVDFGVAKLSNMTTLTREGTTMGTIAYMSPEQLRGEPVDARTDIWSLGVILHEMISAEHPFGGSDYESCAVSILAGEPASLTNLGSGTPQELQAIVSKCLRKDPGDRYQHVEEVSVDLRALRKPGISLRSALKPSRPPASPLRWKRTSPVLAVAIAILAIMGWWQPWRSTPSGTIPTVRFKISLPEGESLMHHEGGGSWHHIAISPDGLKLAYEVVSSEGSKWNLHLRDLGSLEDRAIPGTEFATAPFFSPDGQWLGFFDVSSVPFTMKKVSTRGGFPANIAVGSSGGSSWGMDGTIVFTKAWGWNKRELWSISADTGSPERITEPRGFTPNNPEQSHRWPDILPGGKAILYTALTSSYRDMSIKVLDLETGEAKTLVTPGTSARYSPTGHLVFAWAGNLLAVQFDVEALVVTGPPVVVQEDIMVGWSGNAHFDFSDNGTLVYVPGNGQLWGPGQPASLDLVWVDHEGNEEPLWPWSSDLLGPRLSPDGTQLAGYRERRGLSVWIYDLERGTGRPVSRKEEFALWPIWTPDGHEIVYSSNLGRGSTLSLFRQQIDKGLPPQQLIDRARNQESHTWSHDGTALIFTEADSTGWDILELAMDGDPEIRPVVATPSNETNPTISPNGQWLAFTSDVTGSHEVFIQRYPSSSSIRQVSVDGGKEPLWAADGKTLYYRRLNNNVMTVSVKDDGSLRLGEPRLLFNGNYAFGDYAGRNWDLSPDGTRFLMSRRPKTGSPPTEFVVVVNWFDELKRIMARE